jgi:ABC-type branched-subunit amino acid transport system permease subunit
MAGGRCFSGAHRRADRSTDRPRREVKLTLDLVGPIAYASFFLIMALINAIICLGLNVQWGQTGLFNVGIAGFVAIGAYASALLTTPPSGDHLGGFDMPILAGWIVAYSSSCSTRRG